MSSRARSRGGRKAEAEQRSPSRTSRDADPSTRPGSTARGALQDPRSLTPAEVVQLQRAVGNRAVDRLLSGESQGTDAGRAPDDASVRRRRDGRTATSDGLPDRLRAALEALSGSDLSDVRVHYDSPEPARVDALAYTRGRDIHLASGEERQLPHEGWHAVQQMQGRVEPTTRAGGVPVNDDAGLEREADRMGERALRTAPASTVSSEEDTRGGAVRQRARTAVRGPIQRQEAEETADTGSDSAAQQFGDVSVHIGRTTTVEAGLREVYRQGARRISEEALRMVGRGASVEDAARWAVRARNDLKVGIRARGSPVVRGLAEARNVRKYGNRVGPTYEQLIREGKTPEDIIGSSGRANARVNRIATRLRVAGRFLILLDIGVVTWEVYHAEEGDRLRTGVAGAAGVGGALAGGWAGAKGGAAVGSFFGPIGTAVGGVVGGLGGALVGGWLGRRAGEEAYDLVESIVDPPSEEEALMRGIDAREDRYIRTHAQRRQ